MVSPFILGGKVIVAEEDKELLNWESTGVVRGVERDLWNNTSAVEAEGGGPGVRGQPGLYGETQSHPELATFFGTVTELLMETM